MRASPHPRLLLVAALLVGGCSSSMPIEEARTATVVSVDGVTLDGASLEKILLAAPATAGPSTETANLVISAFIDAALLRKALTGEVPLTDSATTARIIEPDAIRGEVRGFMLDRARGYPLPGDQVIDSVTRLGQLRAFQAIAVRYPPSLATDSSVQQGFAARIRGIYEEATGSADFTSLVRQYTTDTTLRARDGFMPAVERSNFGPGRDFDALWRLEYGQVSAPFGVPTGFAMIMRRATVEESRPAVREWLVPVLAEQRNAAWLDSVRAANDVQLTDDALPRFRTLVAEPLVGGGTEPLVTWNGGRLTPEQARLWVSVLSPAERALMPGVPDSALAIFLGQVSDRYLVRQVARGDTVLPTEAWEAMAPQFRDALASLDSAYRGPLTTGEPSVAVRRFIEAITTGTLPYRPLPGATVWVLRQGAQITLDQRAIDAIVTAVTPIWTARQDSLANAAEMGTPATPPTPSP
jgi:hypothetical protein